jgi:hypothetical protein
MRFLRGFLRTSNSRQRHYNGHATCLTAPAVRTLAFCVLWLSMACGCVTTKDYGLGKCTEYKPYLCWGGDMVCLRDDRGCEMCSCQPRFPGTPSP